MLTPPPLLVWGARSQAMLIETMLARQGDRVAFLWDATLTAPAFPSAAEFGHTEADLARFLARAGRYAVAIGGIHGMARRDAARRLAGAGLAPAAVIAPSAEIDPSATLGPGVQVMARAVVHIAARIGAHSIVNTAATIDHECEIGEAVHVMGAAAIAGRVRIGDMAAIGTNATILPDLVIGEGAVVGAGAVVTRDVAPWTTVAGVPARPMRRAP